MSRRRPTLPDVLEILGSLFVAIFWVWATIRSLRTGDDLRFAVSTVFAVYSIRWFLNSGEDQR